MKTQNVPALIFETFSLVLADMAENSFFIWVYVLFKKLGSSVIESDSVVSEIILHNQSVSLCLSFWVTWIQFFFYLVFFLGLINELLSLINLFLLLLLLLSSRSSSRRNSQGE